MGTAHIFISYSRDDTLLMRRVKHTLQEAGLDVWTDEGIEIGTPNWQLAIEHAIETCLCLVCVLTPTAKKSHWVREELVYATFHEKQVYMVHTEGEYKQVAILGFTVAQLIDVRDKDLYQPRMTQLCKRILDEARGRDVTVETHPDEEISLTQKLPEPSELEFDATEALVEEKSEPKSFMPAIIPTSEQHQLIVQRGKQFTATTAFDIGDTFVTVGRDKNSTIYIDDTSVSREHCQLIYTNDGFLLRDMDSANGTYINAERVRIRNLRNKDTIQIGPNISLVYRIMAKGV
jgi:hypothetical protein